MFKSDLVQTDKHLINNLLGGKSKDYFMYIYNMNLEL